MEMQFATSFSANGASHNDSTFRAWCQNLKVALKWDDKSPTRSKIAHFSPEKSGSHFCLFSDKDTSSTFPDTLQKAVLVTQRAHSTTRAEISFQHRCHLSSHVWDTQDRHGNNELGNPFGRSQPDIAQVRVVTRRGNKTQHWNEMKQLSGLNR